MNRPVMDCGVAGIVRSPAFARARGGADSARAHGSGRKFASA